MFQRLTDVPKTEDQCGAADVLRSQEHPWTFATRECFEYAIPVKRKNYGSDVTATAATGGTTR